MMPKNFKTLIWLGIAFLLTITPLAVFGLCILIGMVFNVLKLAFY